MQSGDYQKRNETNEIYIPPGPRLGDKVIEFHNVTKRFDDKLLYQDLSFTIPQGPLSASSAVTARVNRRCSSWSPARSGRMQVTW